MQKIHVAVSRWIAALLSGHQPEPQEAKEAARHFETGHVCRNCESQLVRIPGSDYYWCPTCGADAHGDVKQICMCGAHVGKHDAMLRCSVTTAWADELNVMIRRKVAVVPRAQPNVREERLKRSKPALFDDE